MLGQRIVVKILQRYWRLSRGLTMGAQGAVIDAQGRFLLIRHGYRPGWHFPGGGVEKHETIETALRRELAEEAGIAYDTAPDLFAVYANFDLFPNDHIALFVVRQWHQPSIPRPNAEIAEQGFFCPDAVPQETSRATRARIAEILGTAPKSHFW